MNTRHPPIADLKSWIALGALGLIWGVSFMAVTIAVTGFGPLTVAAGRIGLGAVILFILTRLLGLPLPKIIDRAGHTGWKIAVSALGLSALGLGVFSMAVPFFLLSWGQGYVASGFAGVTMAAGPIITMVLAHFLVQGEHITPAKFAGITLGFIGVIVLIGPGAFDSSGLAHEPLARLACIGAAASYAIGAIITRRAPKVEPISFASIATLFAAAIIVPTALLIEGLPKAPDTASIIAVIFLGVVPTAMANLLLVTIIRRAGPSFMSLVNYQVPIWSVLFGWAFLSEKLSSHVFLALGLILTSVAITQFVSQRTD